MQICFPYLIFPLGFSIYWWLLFKIIFAMTIVKWWFINWYSTIRKSLPFCPDLCSFICPSLLPSLLPRPVFIHLSIPRWTYGFLLYSVGCHSILYHILLLSILELVTNRIMQLICVWLLLLNMCLRYMLFWSLNIGQLFCTFTYCWTFGVISVQGSYEQRWY